MKYSCILLVMSDSQAVLSPPDLTVSWHDVGRAGHPGGGPRLGGSHRDQQGPHHRSAARAEEAGQHARQPTARGHQPGAVQPALHRQQGPAAAAPRPGWSVLA